MLLGRPLHVVVIVTLGLLVLLFCPASTGSFVATHGAATAFRAYRISLTVMTFLLTAAALCVQLLAMRSVSFFVADRQRLFCPKNFASLTSVLRC
jgi:hypothetical protein